MTTNSEFVVLSSKYSSVSELIKSIGHGDVRLDLGCGFYKPPGYIGLDNLIGERAQVRNDENGPDILMDLNNRPLPFPDGSCAEVRSSHFLEHSNLDHIIDESFRVLRPGGAFNFTVPYANSAEGMYPGHSLFLTERWFHENLNFQRKFKIESERYDPSSSWKRLPLLVRALIPFHIARTFLFNACWQMTLQCVAKK